MGILPTKWLNMAKSLPRKVKVGFIFALGSQPLNWTSLGFRCIIRIPDLFMSLLDADVCCLHFLFHKLWLDDVCCLHFYLQISVWKLSSKSLSFDYKLHHHHYTHIHHYHQYHHYHHYRCIQIPLQFGFFHRFWFTFEFDIYLVFLTWPSWVS